LESLNGAVFPLKLLKAIRQPPGPDLALDLIFYLSAQLDFERSPAPTAPAGFAHALWLLAIIAATSLQARFGKKSAPTKTRMCDGMRSRRLKEPETTTGPETDPGSGLLPGGSLERTTVPNLYCNTY
jgi:hypothetical protein